MATKVSLGQRTSKIPPAPNAPNPRHVRASGHRPHSTEPTAQIDVPEHISRDNTPFDVNDDRVPSVPPNEGHNPPSRSVSPQAGSKRQHNADEDENDSEVEEIDVPISKTPKIEKKPFDQKLVISLISTRSSFLRRPVDIMRF